MKKNRSSWNGRQFSRGSSLLEMVLLVPFLLLPLVLCGLDLITMIFANSVNVEMCQKAARAASLGAPSALEAGAPRERALKALNGYFQTGGFLVLQPDVQVTEKINLPPDTEVFGGQINGEVTVQIRSRFKPPFFLDGIVGVSTMEVKACQTYPFTWSVSRKTTALLY